jgi:hypothetical protein
MAVASPEYDERIRQVEELVMLQHDEQSKIENQLKTTIELLKEQQKYNGNTCNLAS